MADIAPFRALYFVPDKAGDLATLIAPPYDVISPALQEELHRRSPYNVVRVILPRRDEEEAAETPYLRAAETLTTWLEEGIMAEDADACLYVYTQEFVCPVSGRQKRRTGLVCALALTPYEEGIVVPHEYTRPAARADRLQLLRACRTNTETILALYEDTRGRVRRHLDEALASATPFLSAVADGVANRVYRVADPSTIEELAGEFADKRIWIADGHHRYETAVTYWRELRERGEELPGADRILVTLTALEDEGLVVMPTHRVIRGVGTSGLEAWREQLAADFVLRDLHDPDAAVSRATQLRSHQGRFVLVCRDSSWEVVLKDPNVMETATPERGPAWRSLDVAIAETLALGRLREAEPAVEVAYVHEAASAVESVRRGDADAAVLLGEPSPQDIRAVTAEGERMPPKSTYFYPKLWSGLFMRRLDR